VLRHATDETELPRWIAVPYYHWLFSLSITHELPSNKLPAAAASSVSVYTRLLLRVPASSFKQV
jgi:hypothetical protein